MRTFKTQASLSLLPCLQCARPLSAAPEGEHAIIPPVSLYAYAHLANTTIPAHSFHLLGQAHEQIEPCSAQKTEPKKNAIHADWYPMFAVLCMLTYSVLHATVFCLPT